MKHQRTKRKAQAALEFMMTYGWAIIAVLAAIGALAYFGVLNPGNLLPEKCLLESGFNCDGIDVQPTSITLIMTMNLPNSINITSISIGGCTNNSLVGQPVGDPRAATSFLVQTGTQERINLVGCDNGLSGDVFSGSATINYVDTKTKLAKKAGGTISSKVA